MFLTILVCGNYVAVAAQDKANAVSDVDKARVFITDSQSWEMAGGGVGSSAGFGGAVHGGARPQTAEIIKTFGERCPETAVNNKQEKADYIVLLDHEGGKGLARDNKVVVFNREGDSILSHSTRSLGNAVKDACAAISKDWPIRGSKSRAVSAPASLATNSDTKSAGNALTIVAVSSAPLNADIEMDGSFVGNTPSTIKLAPGAHLITVKKTGYKNWDRKINVSGGSVNLSAELEKAQ